MGFPVGAVFWGRETVEVWWMRKDLILSQGRTQARDDVLSPPCVGNSWR